MLHTTDLKLWENFHFRELQKKKILVKYSLKAFLNSKSLVEIKTKMIGLVGFYGISTVGYLMPNPVYVCIVNTFCR